MKLIVPDIDQYCRIEGKRPSKRQQWTAFYRLYRLALRGAQAGGVGVGSDNPTDNVGEVFRVLQPDWSALWLVEADAELPARSRLPKLIRQRMVERERAKRLSGERTMCFACQGWGILRV